MAAITPDTQIRLLKVDLSMDESNELTFSNKSAQTDYFLSLTHDTEQDNCTYMRKDGVIRYPKHIDSILKYNYVMYKNNHYSNKWFYAFITNMEYANDGMTNISIKTDVFQTWQFDINYKSCFVEREHVNNDTVGLHTVPEGLETGDYIVNSTAESTSQSDLCIVTASTVGPSDYESYVMEIYNKIPSPVVYCKWNLDNTSSGLTGLKNFINGLNGAGKIEAMQYMFFAPTWLCPTNGTVYINNSNSTADESMSIDPITSLNGYTPANKKLLCYPYCYYGLSNNVGQFNILKPELWEKLDGKLNVLIRGVLTPGCSIKAYPYKYDGINMNFEEGITGAKYPQLSWSNDLYTNWQTQNGVNIGGVQLDATTTGLLTSGAQIAAGGALVASGDVAAGGMIGSGINGIFNTMQEQYRHSLIPNAVDGCLNSGDINTIANSNKIYVHSFTIKQEFARIIDKFLSMYGYKINSVKIPNITSRRNWNYIKTIDCNLEGDIPQSDLIELKNLFNKGITLWHNPSTFLDYSQSNPII